MGDQNPLNWRSKLTLQGAVITRRDKVNSVFMKLCAILTLLLSLTLPALAREYPEQDAGPPGHAQEQRKSDDVPRMLERVKSRSTAERREAIDQLAEAGDLRAVEPVIAALKDQEGDVRASAANALGQLGDKRAVEPLILMLNDEVSFVRAAAARVLGQLGDAKSVDPLTTSLKDSNSTVRGAAA